MASEIVDPLQFDVKKAIKCAIKRVTECALNVLYKIMCCIVEKIVTGEAWEGLN